MVKKKIKHPQMHFRYGTLLILLIFIATVFLVVLDSNTIVFDSFAKKIGIIKLTPTPIPNNIPNNIIFNPTDVPTSTPTPSVTIIPKQIYAAPANDSDPPVHCKVHVNCGGGTTPLKKSECENSICCQIGNKWIFYKDKNQCLRGQGERTGDSNNTATITYPKYPECLIYYPALGYSRTYTTFSPELCKTYQDQAKSGGAIVYPTNALNTTQTTTTPNTTQPINDPRCSQAYNMWLEYRSNFMANEYNNFSSSYEAMVELNKQKTYIQNLINSYGCSLTLH